MARNEQQSADWRDALVARLDHLNATDPEQMRAELVAARNRVQSARKARRERAAAAAARLRDTARLPGGEAHRGC